MNRPRRLLSTITIIGAMAAHATAGSEDALARLIPERVASIQILLNAGGVDLGYVSDIPGDDPAVRELIELLHARAEPTTDHKCGNRGSIRFHLLHGAQLWLGLLPGHTEGFYQLRLYQGDTFVAIYRIERRALLAALGNLGVPLGSYAFAEQRGDVERGRVA